MIPLIWARSNSSPWNDCSSSLRSSRRVTDMETFRYCTLHSLLRARDLSLVSSWSPTFLPALLAPLEGWTERLCRDLHDGALTPPAPLPPEIARRLTPARPHPSRAAFLSGVFDERLTRAEKLARIWPRLALLSCWTDAAAASCLQELREAFPEVEIQPKGLLATEGCVTVPLVDVIAPALALRSHFFEFQEAEGGQQDAKCRLAHELEAGASYQVMLTTGGGLYRYGLGDVVQVAGFLNECPLLRFLGKADRVSDLVGEKLLEAHVSHVLNRAFAALRLKPHFALLTPVTGRPAHYRLYLRCDGLGAKLKSILQAELESGLRENPHYQYAVRLGQHSADEIAPLRDGESAWRVYERRYLELGQQAGTIKPAALDPWTGWAAEFCPLEDHSPAS